jgi:hypothetical protein
MQHAGPLGITALPPDSVEVIDPAHPFYGLTLPLIGMTTNPHLGRVCVVELQPGVERLVPVAATDRGGVLPAPSPCRLSPGSIVALLAVVAFLPDPTLEHDHGPARPDGASPSGSAPTAAPARLRAHAQSDAPVPDRRTRVGSRRGVGRVKREPARPHLPDRPANLPGASP